jgi:tetratricopeptide (TPR) repeat protein
VSQAGNEDPLIRWAVVRALQYAPAPMIARYAPAMLEDPVRAVRVEAANALAPVSLELLPVHAQGILPSVLNEYVDAELVSNERAEAHTNIGNLQRKLRRADRSESAFKVAIDLNPFFVPAYVNLADLYREQEREVESEALLKEALMILPEQPALHYSLGLSLFRQGRAAEAREELLLAAESDTAGPQMALAYALILDAQGETDTAINYLIDAQKRFGNDPGLLSALINLYQRTNQHKAAEPLMMQLRNL